MSEWGTALIVGALFVIAWFLAKIHTQLMTIIGELEMMNQDRRSVEFYRAVDAENASSDVS